MAPPALLCWTISQVQPRVNTECATGGKRLDTHGVEPLRRSRVLGRARHKGCSEVDVEPWGAEFWEVCCLHEMPAYVHAEVALPGVAVWQRLVAVVCAGQPEKPVRAPLQQNLDQWRVTALAELAPQLGQVVPVPHRDATAEARNVVAVQIQVRVVGILQHNLARPVKRKSAGSDGVTDRRMAHAARFSASAPCPC